MKKILTLLAVCAMLCACSSDWGALETVNYPISGEYHALDISNAFQVTMSETVSEPVAIVTIGEKAHQYVRVEVINGTLYIGIKKWKFTSNEKATVILPVADIDDLRVSGASSFNGTMDEEKVKMKVSGASRFDGAVHCENADIELSGASHFEGAMYCENADIGLSGASRATINGYCMEELDIDISGASELDGVRFPCTTIVGKVSGASEADVTCCESLKVEVSGASKIIYGTPSDECDPNVDCECSGGSSVHSR